MLLPRRQRVESRKIVEWIARHQRPFDVHVEDETLATFMAAVQGPRVPGVASATSDVEISNLNYYSGSRRWSSAGPRS